MSASRLVSSSAAVPLGRHVLGVRYSRTGTVQNSHTPLGDVTLFIDDDAVGTLADVQSHPGTFGLAGGRHHCRTQRRFGGVQPLQGAVRVHRRHHRRGHGRPLRAALSKTWKKNWRWLFRVTELSVRRRRAPIAAGLLASDRVASSKSASRSRRWRRMTTEPAPATMRPVPASLVWARGDRFRDCLGGHRHIRPDPGSGSTCSPKTSPLPAMDLEQPAAEALFSYASRNEPPVWYRPHGKRCPLSKDEACSPKRRVC